MPDVTFSKSMPAVNGNPDVSFKPTGHRGASTHKPTAIPAGESTPHVRDGSVYVARVSNKERHKSLDPARGPGLLRETPVLEVIH